MPKISETLYNIDNDLDSNIELLVNEYQNSDLEISKKIAITSHIQSLYESISDDLESLIQYAKDAKS